MDCEFGHGKYANTPKTKSDGSMPSGTMLSLVALILSLRTSESVNIVCSAKVILNMHRRV